jgi:hypothetical protein
LDSHAVETKDNMKKSITMIALLAGAVGVYAQGTIELGDYIPLTFTIDVFSPQTSGPYPQMTGNTSLDYPAGTVEIGPGINQYQGVPLGGADVSTTSEGVYGNGNLWSLAIYAAPGINNTTGLVAAESTGQPVAVSLFQTTGGIGIANAGTAGDDSAGVWALNKGSTATTTLAGFTGGATIQLVAWYNGGVAPTLANADAGWVASPVEGWSAFESIAELGGLGSGAAPSLADFIPGDGQITSFSVVGDVNFLTPEPSVVALTAIGGLLFGARKWFARR